MTNAFTQRLFAAALLFIGVQTASAGGSGDLTASSPFRYATMPGATVDSAELIGRVERALASYATACASRDEQAMAKVFTGFAVIAYASNIPGRFIAGDAITADRCWAGSALIGQFSSESPIWIYPTGDPNDVFVQYASVVGTGTAQRTAQVIALVEMAGDRIAQIRDFGSLFDLEP